MCLFLKVTCYVEILSDKSGLNFPAVVQEKSQFVHNEEKNDNIFKNEFQDNNSVCSLQEIYVPAIKQSTPQRESGKSSQNLKEPVRSSRQMSLQVRRETKGKFIDLTTQRLPLQNFNE